ncbi:molybdopterin molybdotransferase MoeA [Isoptericola sp. b515]|uniref:molybdopterin molybdotransferase MoeA n=1 Tax=Isoptericola sp. b515 TaxID=3064652 RepID=UPI00271389D6|nr:molybdopterin molybdotransferase MoeA [Isoptericola sp. b515]MDO8146853.1 molybdopterin molybdotransferase MoeA [Isoptericola sp. b515]
MTTGRPRTIAEHTRAALARVQPLPVTPVRLDDPTVVGLVLADDVAAAAPVPAFDHAAMDGYAVRLDDLPADGSAVTLPVLADRRPGRPSPTDVVGMKTAAPDPPGVADFLPTTAAGGAADGGAVRIMTGAPVPDGFDAVVPVERTSTGHFVAGGPTTERTVTLSRQARDHVRRAGTDLRRGDPIARAGDVVGPGLVATAAAAGLVELPVRRRPRVAVLSTGSELAPLGTTETGTIADSNSLMLAALVRAAGADVVRIGAVPDDADALRAALDHVVGMKNAGPDRPEAADFMPTTGVVDLIVTSGGVSAGASDVVRELLDSPDVADVDVATVAVRPGKPQALATWRGTPWIAVPGNPVSAFVSTVLYALPAVRRLAGLDVPPAATARAAVGWPSPSGTEQVVPVVTGPDGVAPAGPDVHRLSALTAADALVVVPADVEHVAPGDRLPLVPIPGAR